MANTPTFKTTAELDPAGPKTGAEIIEVIQDGVSKKMTATALLQVERFDELEVADAKTGQEVLEVFQDGEAKKMTASDLMKFDRYDLGKTTSTGALDLATGNYFEIDNTAAGAKPITITNAPAGRAMVIVVKVKGKVGQLTWPGNVTWNASTAPDMGTTSTLVVLLWDGVAFTGAQGATI